MPHQWRFLDEGDAGMTIAELHGKLSPHRHSGCHDRMEDLLTSDVFGTMRYAGWKWGFMDWLRSAISPEDSARRAGHSLPQDDAIIQVHFDFWPTLPNGREPDLLLAIEKRNHHIDLVMVEAKYLSGPSDIHDLDRLTVSGVTGNQLADQINVFPKQWRREERLEVDARHHLYITADYSCPTEVYLEAAPLIENLGVHQFWLNWQSLNEFLKPHQVTADDSAQALLTDLSLLLERKGLVPYEGFRQTFQVDLGEPSEWGFWQGRWWRGMKSPALPESWGFWKEKWWVHCEAPRLPKRYGFWRG